MRGLSDTRGGLGKRGGKRPGGYRCTWSEVDLGAIEHNMLRLKRLLDDGVKILATVKADAYGHGMLEVSDILVKAGIDYLGVATTDEALCLRENGFKIPVLLLSSVLDGEIEVVIKHRITQTVADMRLARRLEHCAAKMNRKAKVHVKIDTGMGRIGVWHEDAECFIEELLRLKHIEVEGIFTHFPSAGKNRTLTLRQIKDFSFLMERLERQKIYIRYRHAANSIAVIGYKESHMKLVRPGIMLYGISPGPDTTPCGVDIRPALSLKSRIVFIKDAPPGRRISYGGTFITTRRTKIATIPIGYADGFNLRLSNKGSVLIRGRRAPVLGRVCMDHIMVDIGRIPGACVGDEAVIIGAQGRDRICIEEVAKLCGTIPYEVACWFNSRVKRIYRYNNKVYFFKK